MNLKGQGQPIKKKGEYSSKQNGNPSKEYYHIYQ
jgi:hypothetical protein